MAMFTISKNLLCRFNCYSYHQAITGRKRNSFYLWTHFVCRLDRNNLRCYSEEKKWITIYLEKSDGIPLRRAGKIGATMYDTLRGDPDFLEYGACEGTQACSTCHVIFTKEDFTTISKYKNKREQEEAEKDLLDEIHSKFDSGEADFRTETSRLGCCVTLVPEMDGMVIKIPKTKSLMDN